MNVVKERLKAEAASLAQAAQSSLEKVKSSEQLANLKERAVAAARVAEEKATAAGLSNHLDTARSSFSNLLRAGDEARGESSDDTSHAEDERLVHGESPDGGNVTDKMRAGLSAFGSKLGEIGLAGKARLESTVESAKQASANVAHAGQLAREASAKSLDDARQAGANVAHKGADGFRTAAAASSSGMDRLKSVTADAKGRCGEAISAAAAVSGVGVPGVKKEKQCFELTYRQRLIGCAACLLAGTLLSIFSLGSIAALIVGNPGPFAFKYTLGNLLSLGAASFLVGPRTQARGMLAPQRRLASLMYVATLVGTLVSVFVLKKALLSLLFILLQFFALTWYMLSYIPYGHTAAKRIMRRLLRRGGFLGADAAGAHASSTISPAEGE